MTSKSGLEIDPGTFWTSENVRLKAEGPYISIIITAIQSGYQHTRSGHKTSLHSQFHLKYAILVKIHRHRTLFGT